MLDDDVGATSRATTLLTDGRSNLYHLIYNTPL